MVLNKNPPAPSPRSKNQRAFDLKGHLLIIWYGVKDKRTGYPAKQQTMAVHSSLAAEVLDAINMPNIKLDSRRTKHHPNTVGIARQ